MPALRHAPVIAIGFFALASEAATITGRVVSGSSPVSGVQVVLTPRNLSTTTGSDGVFRLEVPTSILPGPENFPDLSLNNGRLVFHNPADQPVRIALYSADGAGRSLLQDRFLAPGRHEITLRDWAAGAGSGIYLLSISNGRHQVHAKIALTGGRIRTASAFAAAGPAGPIPLLKGAAAGDTLTLTKSGFVSKKVPLPDLNTRNLGDITFQAVAGNIAVGTSAYDMHDAIIQQSTTRNGLNADAAMVLKAMIMIESTFKVDAISMWDTQLPCGTHSYGLMQVTPGCFRSFATLSSGSPTATISGGLNGVPATLNYFNAADRTNGNTIVQENGILINLVSNPSNSLYPNSAFNPSYAIDWGARALSQFQAEMRNRFGGCSNVQYMHMALAGYNQGSLTVTGCNAFSPNGRVYVDKVIGQYRTWCQRAGIPVVY